MIAGSVNSRREAIVEIEVVDSGDQRHAISAVIDTGFSEYLCIPLSAIAALGLQRVCRVRMTLADGSEELMATYKATVIWEGVQRVVEVQAGKIDPFLGMAMLAGHELRIQVAEGGAVTIEAMS